MPLLVLYTTHPDKACADRISKILLDKHLVACANMYAMSSLYRWRGEIVKEEEWVAIFKTTPEHIQAIEQVFIESHPYDVPCVVRWEAGANDSYEKWVNEETHI